MALSTSVIEKQIFHNILNKCLFAFGYPLETKIHRRWSSSFRDDITLLVQNTRSNYQKTHNL